NDQIGGGFARYSVDAEWLVPHFEKMLYDNAQLLSLYTRAWLMTGAERYREVVASTIGWLEREMRAPGGGLHAALDADSEGVEGKFYVWSLDEVARILTPDELDFAIHHYGITDHGNFEGSSILIVARPLGDLADAMGMGVDDVTALRDRVAAKLLAARSDRVRPGTDTKVIVSWNALTVKALAEAGMAFGQPDWTSLATHIAEVLVSQGRSPSGRLGRTIVDGRPAGQGMLEDYGALADALLTLYRATADQQWLDVAGDLVDTIQQEFGHSSGVGFFDTATDHETLIIRPRDVQDGALPSGNALAIDAMLTIAQLRHDEPLEQRVRDVLASLAAPMGQHPAAFGRFLAVLERTLADETTVVIAGDPHSDAGVKLRDTVIRAGGPLVDLAYAAADLDERWPQLSDRPIPSGADAAAFVCRGMVCLPPVTDPQELTALLESGLRP
ncbi:MAG TPA: hypothetical protein VD767_12295, partial [Thermomicrobiales bacterium]|nr:hypothetical protein [Thermomicrobiales bacterium]